MKKEKTSRGFTIYRFKDSYGVDCSLQKSSSVDDKIWIGANDIGIKHFKAGRGWEDIKFPEDTLEEQYVANNRIILDRKQVKKLLPFLQKFVETGEI